MDLKSQDENWTEREIQVIHIHPKFDTNSKAAYFDVAVLAMDKPVEFSDQVKAICLPQDPIEDPDHFSGDSVSVSGWGKTHEEATETSDVMKTAKLLIYRQRYKFIFLLH